MQPGFFWRGNRERLSPQRFGGDTETEALSERRAIGAMLLFRTVDRGVRLVFRMPDENKTESVGGMPLVSTGCEHPWGTLGGGRQGRETFFGVLSREAREELGTTLSESFPFDWMSRQYFVVNQLKQGESQQELHQIAVWAASLLVIPDSYLQRTLSLRGEWVPEDEILPLVQSMDSLAASAYRPHFLVALGMSRGLIPDEELRCWNKAAYAARELYRNSNLIVRDGVVGVDGGLHPQALQEAAQFLRV